jgi:hypothetical protein
MKELINKKQVKRIIEDHLVPNKIKKEEVDFVAQVIVEHQNEICSEILKGNK